MAKIETGRICVICGKRTSPHGRKDTYGFGTFLRRNGIFYGRDKAHPDCVKEYEHVKAPTKSRQGVMA